MSISVLMIDDDKDDRFFFKEALTEANLDATCIFGHNGEHGLQMLSNVQKLPDYIFLDINMPRFNGKECLRLIKQNPLWANITIVMYSTSSSELDIEETKALGASYYLTKPACYDSLCVALSLLLGSAITDVTHHQNFDIIPLQNEFT